MQNLFNLLLLFLVIVEAVFSVNEFHAHKPYQTELGLSIGYMLMMSPNNAIDFLGVIVGLTMLMLQIHRSHQEA